MRVSTMRFVDRAAGVPLCGALTLARSAARALPGGGPGPLERILFVKLAEQGSTVLAYPALRRAAEMVGRENVWFLVFRENRFILDALDAIPPENVVEVDAGSLRRVTVSSLAAVRRLRKLDLSAAVDLEFFARSSAVFGYLSGARARAGFHPFGGEGPWRGDLLTHRLVYNPHLHTAHAFLSLVESLSRPPEELPAFDWTPPPLERLPFGEFRPDEEEREETAGLIRGLAGTEEVPPLVLLNANCSDLLPLRKWDGRNYVELARRLLDRFPDLFVAFTGTPGEAPAVDRLAEGLDDRRVFSLAGRTSLRQLLVAYTLADLLVTNDSGPAHFAALTPIDVIALFGPETPELFGAPSPRHRLLWARLPCSPCVNAYNNRLSRCRNNLCMQRIGVGEVFERACAALAARGR